MDIKKIKGFLSKKYEFIKLIGTGGFAEVHLAKDKLLERKVAIKILFPQFSSDSAIIERFIREAKLYAKLEHKNLIPIYDTGIIDEYAFIIMKYIQGASLNSLLLEEGKLSIQLIAPMIKEIASTLDYIHSKGIVHRDVKPSNIIIEEDSNKYYLADFGIARSDTSKTLTKSGLILGTPNYISPEQIKGKQIDHRADLYALGAMCYELITGKPIFSGESSMEVLYQHVNEEPEPLANIIPDIPKNILYIVTKCLEKNPDKRFQSADEILDVFETKRGTFISRYFKEKEARKVKSVQKKILLLFLLIVFVTGTLFIIKKVSTSDEIKEPIISNKISTKDTEENKKPPVIQKSETPENKKNEAEIEPSKSISQKTEPKDKKTVIKKIQELKKGEIKKKPKTIHKTSKDKKTQKEKPVVQPIGPGVIKFTSSVPAYVYHKEEKIGDTYQLFQKEYKPGEYTFKFVIPDYQTFQRDVTVTRGKTIHIHQKFSPYGIITITASPFARFYINNIDYGTTESIYKKKLPVGEYTIKAVKAGYITQEKTVSIEKRKSENIHFILKKEGNKNE